MSSCLNHVVILIAICSQSTSYCNNTLLNHYPLPIIRFAQYLQHMQHNAVYWHYFELKCSLLVSRFQLPLPYEYSTLLVSFLPFPLLPAPSLFQWTAPYWNFCDFMYTYFEIEIRITWSDFCSTCSIYFDFKHNPIDEGKEAAERHLLSLMTATVCSQTRTIFVKLKNLTC